MRSSTPKLQNSSAESALTEFQISVQFHLARELKPSYQRIQDRLKFLEEQVRRDQQWSLDNDGPRLAGKVTHRARCQYEEEQSRTRSLLRRIEAMVANPPASIKAFKELLNAERMFSCKQPADDWSAVYIHDAYREDLLTAFNATVLARPYIAAPKPKILVTAAPKREDKKSHREVLAKLEEEVALIKPNHRPLSAHPKDQARKAAMVNPELDVRLHKNARSTHIQMQPTTQAKKLSAFGHFAARGEAKRSFLGLQDLSIVQGPYVDRDAELEERTPTASPDPEPRSSRSISPFGRFAFSPTNSAQSSDDQSNSHLDSELVKIFSEFNF